MSAGRPYRERVPPEPGPPAASKEDTLGGLRSVHAPPPLSRALVAPVLFTAFIAGVGVAIGGPVAVVAPFALLAFAIMSWSAVGQRGRSAELHADGLVLVHGAGRDAIAFEDVNEVWFELDVVQGRAGASLQALRLVDHGGVPRRVPLGVAGAPALVGAVLRACSTPLLADAKRALAEGETLTFGKVLVDRIGITVGKARLPWSEIRLAVVARGKVSFYRRFPIFAWATVRLDQVPHPTVFGALVAQYAVKTRVDDAILVAFATSSEQAAARNALGPDFHLRQMLVGGVLFLIGALVTWATFANKGTWFLFAYGPMIGGALAFFRGLAGYLSKRR